MPCLGMNKRIMSRSERGGTDGGPSECDVLDENLKTQGDAILEFYVDTQCRIETRLDSGG